MTVGPAEVQAISDASAISGVNLGGTDHVTRNESFLALQSKQRIWK